METIIKHGRRNYLVDTSAQRITFLDTRFYYDESGRPLPSVTTILECYPKTAAFFEWLKKHGQDADEIRDEAGNKGSRVHKLTERYDNGEEVSLLTDTGEIDMSLVEWSMFERYVDFSTRFKPEIEHVEIQATNSFLGYAGTIDRVMKLNGKRYIMDIKTSSAPHPHYWLQLAAYKHLLETNGMEGIDGIALLWLNAKTRTEGRGGAVQGKGWQLLFPDQPCEYYLDLFNSVHKLWLAENADMVPRQVSYSLKHKN